MDYEAQMREIMELSDLVAQRPWTIKKRLCTCSLRFSLVRLLGSQRRTRNSTEFPYNSKDSVTALVDHGAA